MGEISLRRSWAAPVVLTATGVVCVFGLWAVSKSDKPSPKSSSEVAVSAPTYQDIAGWKLETFGELADVTAVDQLLNVSNFQTGTSGRVLCPDLLAETTRAMNVIHPAPDDQMQKELVTMLNSYKSAGDKCVAGDVSGSFNDLRIAEKAQKELGLR
jgi:hypothetical protein